MYAGNSISTTAVHNSLMIVQTADLDILKRCPMVLKSAPVD